MDITGNITGILSNAWRYLRGEFGFGSTYIIGQNGPMWIPTEKPREVYDSIPQYKTVVDRDCAMFSNMVLKLVDKDGKEIEDKDFIRLMQNPNPLQSMNEFLFNYKQQLNVYANQFLYKNKPSPVGDWPATLMNISPFYLQVIVTGKVFDQIELAGIIKEYKYINTANNSVRTFKVDEIMFTRLPDIDNPLKGCGNLQSLRMPLSNIKASYQYLNVVDTELGGIGILTNKTKDQTGNILLKPEEKKEIQKNLIEGYGIKPGQKRIHVATGDLGFQSITYPVAEMMLMEQIDHYYLTIIDAFKHSPFLYSNKNGTYENVKNGIIQTYQDAIYPAADLFTQALTKFLNLKDGKKIIASYDHIEILKENKLEGMKAFETVVRSLTQAVQAGMISGVQAENILANELGVTVDPTGKNSILNALNRLSPLVANNVLGSMTPNEQRGLVNLPAKDGGDDLPPAAPTGQPNVSVPV